MASGARSTGCEGGAVFTLGEDGLGTRLGDGAALGVLGVGEEWLPMEELGEELGALGAGLLCDTLGDELADGLLGKLGLGLEEGLGELGAEPPPPE